MSRLLFILTNHLGQSDIHLLLRNSCLYIAIIKLISQSTHFFDVGFEDLSEVF
jgi:hypothetical protein